MSLIRKQFHAIWLQKGRRVDIAGQGFPVIPPDEGFFGGGGGQLFPLGQLCFKHFAAYCIIGTMSGALAEGSAQLCNQITAFLNFCRLEKGLSANSLDAYSADLARFQQFIGDSPGLPGTPEIRHHIDNLYQSGLSSRSVGRHLTTLRNFYGYLLREGEVATDPAEHLRTPRQWQTIPKYLNLAE